MGLGIIIAMRFCIKTNVDNFIYANVTQQKFGFDFLALVFAAIFFIATVIAVIRLSAIFDRDRNEWLKANSVDWIKDEANTVTID